MQVPNDAPYTSESWPQVEKNKAAMITRLDADVGKLRDKLKEYKIDQNTVIFFTSDNGPHKEGGVDPNFFHSSGPFRGIKRDLYEGGIRVPLIAYWPGKIKAGETSQPFAFWDFMPTAAAIAGATVPKPIDGLSMLPTLLGRSQTNHHEGLYWEFHERGFQQAVRMDNWKAVRPQADQALELYDLAADPGEAHNAADSHPEIITKMEEYLKSARTESPDWPIQKPVKPTENKGS
jgi:arylsulfatase A-like enzyme